MGNQKLTIQRHRQHWEQNTEQRQTKIIIMNIKKRLAKRTPPENV
jgi:hypothetical protein